MNTSMDKQQFIANIKATFATGLELIVKKNADYSTVADPFSNFKAASIVGLGVERAILLRVLDKIARISNLLDKDANVADESLEDSLVDSINYLAILKAYREMTKLKQHEITRQTQSQHAAMNSPSFYDTM